MAESQPEILNEEYETQFYEFVPSDIMVGVNVLIKDIFEDTIKKLKIEMSKIPTKILPENELNLGIEQLQKISHEKIEKTFSKLNDHVLNNIMKIPSHILLPEDSIQSTNYSEEDIERLNEEINELKKQIKCEKYVEAVLKEELKDIEMVSKDQKKLLESTLSPTTINAIEDQTEKLKFLSLNCQESLKGLNTLPDNVCDTESTEAFRNILECSNYK